jgi:hypothetical protein
MITRQSIIEAYVFLRTNNQSLPDEVLDFIKGAALEKLGEVKDAEGRRLHEGDRVYAFHFNGRTRVYGTLLRNDDYKEVSEWCVEYDDGEKCAILDFSQLWKA